MTAETKKNIIESVKDFLRLELLAVVPVLIVAFEQPNVTTRAILIMTVVAALKGVDSYLHKIDSRLQVPF